MYYDKVVELCAGKDGEKASKTGDGRRKRSSATGGLSDQCGSRGGLKEARDFIEKYTNHPFEEEYVAFPVFITSLVGVAVVVILLSVLVYCCTGKDAPKKSQPSRTLDGNEDEEYDDEEQEYRNLLKNKK